MGLRDDRAVGDEDATWVDSAEQREANPELAAMLAPRPRSGVLPTKKTAPRPAPSVRPVAPVAVVAAPPKPKRVVVEPSVVVKEERPAPPAIDRNEMTLPFQMPVHMARPAPVPVRASEESTVIMANVPVAPPSRPAPAPASRPDSGELPAFVASVETAIVTPPSLRAMSLDADARPSRRRRREPLSKRVVVSAVCMAIFTFGAAVGSISLGTQATSGFSQPHLANALTRGERPVVEGLPQVPQAPTAWRSPDDAEPAPVAAAPAPAPVRPKAPAAAGRSVTVAAPPKATATPARVVESSKDDVSSAKQTSSAAAGILENSLGGR